MTIATDRTAFTAARADAYIEDVERSGFCIVRNAVPRTEIDRLNAELDPLFDRAPFCTGSFYGDRTKRFNGLLKRAPMAADLVLHPLVMRVVEALLQPYCDTIQLNLTQAIEIHPGAPIQPPHRDQDSWPYARPDIEYCVNVMWALQPYRAVNGATRLWPGSHRQQDAMLLPEEAAVAAEMEPGDCAIFTGSTLHQGGANFSPRARRGVIVGYALGWLKPHENQWLTYPPEIARTFSPELAALVGYRQHYPNLGNWEGRCPSILLAPAAPDLPGPVDHIAPDKVELMRAYLSGAFRDAA